MWGLQSDFRHCHYFFSFCWWWYCLSSAYLMIVNAHRIQPKRMSLGSVKKQQSCSLVWQFSVHIQHDFLIYLLLHIEICLWILNASNDSFYSIKCFIYPFVLSASSDMNGSECLCDACVLCTNSLNLKREGECKAVQNVAVKLIYCYWVQCLAQHRNTIDYMTLVVYLW